MIFLVLLAVIVSCSAITNPAPPADAADLLLLSFAAYCGDGVSPNFTCYWCSKVGANISLVGTFGDAGGSGFGYVAIYNGETVVIVYRGTDNLAGWIRDAEFTQTQLPFGAPDGARVHKGFFDIVSGDHGAILALYAKGMAQCGPQCGVVLTGHSLGASLATLEALFLANDAQISNLRIVNFGSPRLFNPAGATWVFGNESALGFASVLRITSMHDPVPHLPPHNFIEKYQHLPVELWETSNNPLQFQACSETNGEDPNCADSVPAYKWNVLNHALYMGQDALDGVVHGCLYTDS
jgi:hypothetical protein